MRRCLIIFAVVANLVLADAVTKEIASGHLKDRPQRTLSVVEGYFNLSYVENRGCAWGMFQGQVWPLAAFGVLALGFLIWKRKMVFSDLRGVMRVTEPLLYAGIIGNVIDRVYRGYVIDFFDFHWREAYHFPCFNVADSFITIAAALLVLSSFFSRKECRG